MDKKKVIVIGVALVAVIIIIAGVSLALLAGDDQYEQKLNLANRYLEQGDYTNAILVLQDAIALDPEREEAYIKLYNAYVACGSNENARLTLQQGIRATGSQVMESALEQLDEIMSTPPVVTQPPASNDPIETRPIPVETKLENHTLNRELLSFLSSANYNDYCVNYGTASVTTSNGQYSVRVGELPATLVYYDTTTAVVIDQTRGVPFNQFQPNSISLDDVTILFGGYDIDYMTLKNLNGVMNPLRDGNQITFEYQSCHVSITCTDEGMVTSSSANTITPDSEQTPTEVYEMEANVVSVVDGTSVSGAEVNAYAGYGTYSTPITGTTDSNGKVLLELTESGTYTIEISKDGYITETFEIYVTAYDTQFQKSFAISPEMSEDAIRFVLTWGSYPADLDLWLIGTASDGTSVRVSFLDMRETNANGAVIAELDVDDMSGYGPETMTLLDPYGSYTLTVVDYRGTGDMSLSGAQVKIYIGSSLYTVVDVPGGLENGWQICLVENGNLTITNTAQAAHSGRPQ